MRAKKRQNMMISASELKNNLGKYIDMAETEDIYVTKNGKQRIKISSAKQRPLAFIDGIFKGLNITDEEIKDLKWERLKNV